MQGFTPCQCYQINQLLGAKLIVAKCQHLLEICIARMKIFFKFFSSRLKFFFTHSNGQSGKRFPNFFLILVSNFFFTKLAEENYETGLYSTTNRVYYSLLHSPFTHCMIVYFFSFFQSLLQNLLKFFALTKMRLDSIRSTNQK